MLVTICHISSVDNLISFYVLSTGNCKEIRVSGDAVLIEYSSYKCSVCVSGG